MRGFAHAFQFRNRRRLSRAGAGHSYPIHQKEFGLFDLIGDIEIARQRVGTMLLFDVAEDLDVFAAEGFAQAQELAGATFDDACAADVREHITFDAQEIQVSGMGDLEGGFVCCLKHLQPDWPFEPFANFFSDSRE